MEEKIKNRVIIILSILALIFLIASVGSSSNRRKQRDGLQKERAIRLGLEEKVDILTKERAALKLDLDKINPEYEAAKKSLAQEELVNKELKDELQKLNLLKEQLEENLKETLINKPQASQ